MALPKSQVLHNKTLFFSISFFLQVLTLFKKLELGDVTREMSSSEVSDNFSRLTRLHLFQDFLGSIKDINVKEIIAKESLEYQVSWIKYLLNKTNPPSFAQPSKSGS